MWQGGSAGVALFERSREAPKTSPADGHTGGRRKVTLATNPVSPPNFSDVEAE
jgi:hypothetical protein